MLGSQWPSSRDIVSSHADLQITDLHVMYKIIDAVCVYISAQLVGWWCIKFASSYSTKTSCFFCCVFFLITEWLVWLHTSWRDMHATVIGGPYAWKTNCSKLRGSCNVQFILQPQYTLTLTTFRTSVKESLQMHFEVVVSKQLDDSLTSSEGCHAVCCG